METGYRKVEWKCATTTRGEVCVMMGGMLMMPG